MTYYVKCVIMGIVSTGNSTIERLYMYRWLYREGIIYYADISLPCEKWKIGLVTYIKLLGLSAEVLSWIFDI